MVADQSNDALRGADTDGRDDDVDITLGTVWRTAHPLVKRLCLSMPPLGLAMLAVGVWGDEAGWWADRSFLTNLYSGTTSLMFGLPFGLLVVTRITVSATEYAEKIEQKFEEEVRARNHEHEEMLTREREAALAREAELLDQKLRREAEVIGRKLRRELVRDTRGLYTRLTAISVKMAPVFSALFGDSVSPIERHELAALLRATFDQAAHIAHARDMHGLNAPASNSDQTKVLGVVEHMDPGTRPPDLLKAESAWSSFLHAWRDVTAQDERAAVVQDGYFVAPSPVWPPVHE